MRQAIKDWHTGSKGRAVRGFFHRHWPSLAFIVCFAILGSIILRVSDLAEQNRALVTGTRSALIAACENNRGPLNKYFMNQLAESRGHGVDYYRKLFPDFPPEQLRKSILRQRGQLKSVIAVTDPTACADQYR